MPTAISNDKARLKSRSSIRKGTGFDPLSSGESESDIPEQCLVLMNNLMPHKHFRIMEIIIYMLSGISNVNFQSEISEKQEASD
jgi:hypothetical protein